jgi:hypothetical protein
MFEPPPWPWQGALSSDQIAALAREAAAAKQDVVRLGQIGKTDLRLAQTDDDIAWATRSSMWKNRVETASARRTKRAKAQPALILAGHGVSLRVEKGRADHPKWIYALPAKARNNPLFPQRHRTAGARQSGLGAKAATDRRNSYSI